MQAQGVHSREQGGIIGDDHSTIPPAPKERDKRDGRVRLSGLNLRQAGIGQTNANMTWRLNPVLRLKHGLAGKKSLLKDYDRPSH
jgi:hypothetical protein